ncbi:MAG: hypothetical protein RR057_05825, partial [Clostridia bacterium]
IQNSYSQSLAMLKSSYENEKNSAAAKSMLDAKNTDQFLAARGLAKSGESVQEHINSNLSLNNTLSSLANSNINAGVQLAKSKDSALSSIEKSEAEHAAEKEKSEIAKAQRNEDIKREEKHIADEREYQKEKTDAQRQYEDLIRKSESDLAAQIAKEQREYNEKKYLKELSDKERLINNERAYNESVTESEREYKKNLLNEQREYEKNQNLSHDGTPDTGIVPDSEPKEIAKNLVSTATKGKKFISNSYENVSVYKYLEKLQSEKISEKYLDELILNLDAFGYKEPSKSVIEATELIEAAETEKIRVKKTVYDKLINKGYNEYFANKFSDEDATESVMNYVYQNSSDLESFYTACDILGVDQNKRLFFLTEMNKFVDPIEPSAEKTSPSDASGGFNRKYATK